MDTQEYSVGAVAAASPLHFQRIHELTCTTQVLWLFGEDDEVTEVGTMNMFTFWENEDGEKELVTAPLDDGTILPGVTRDSILELARGWGEFKVCTMELPSRLGILDLCLGALSFRFFRLVPTPPLRCQHHTPTVPAPTLPAQPPAAEPHSAPHSMPCAPPYTLANPLWLAQVSERKYTMPELAKAIEEGRVIECFGAGTAAVVSPIEHIGYMGKGYDVPLDPNRPDHPAGVLTQRVWDSIVGIQYGEVEHEWSVKI